MAIKVSTAIASHLSDVQFEMQSPKLQAQANTRINFVKTLLNRFPDTTQEISKETLDAIWNETVENYG